MKNKFFAVFAALIMLFSLISCDDEAGVTASDTNAGKDAYQATEDESNSIPEVGTETTTAEASDLSDTVKHIEAVDTTATDDESAIDELDTEEVTQDNAAPKPEADTYEKPEAKPVMEETVPTYIPNTAVTAAIADASNCDYVLNTNSMKMHYPSCGSVKTMKAENTSYFIGTRNEAIAQGYDPCGRCKP